jgi:selenocysteine lyase/cysteine desulfurase
LQILGNPDAENRLPIFSFRVTTNGGYANAADFTRHLSDHYGIQARGGCSCAGPYGHRLLQIDPNTSAHLFDKLREGHAIDKPGWIRVNLSYLLTDAKADAIIDGIAAAVADMAA